MRIVFWQEMDAAQRRAALARPAFEARADIAAAVARLIAQVRSDGDQALLALTERFDGVRLKALAVDGAEFAAARARLTPVQHAALERAIANVERFHARPAAWRRYRSRPPRVCAASGLCARIGAVGLYVPAGSAPLPSAVIMLAVPARLAGCPQRVLCTPPARDGRRQSRGAGGGAACAASIRYSRSAAPRRLPRWPTAPTPFPKSTRSSDPANGLGDRCQAAGRIRPGRRRGRYAGRPSEVLVIADDSARPAFVAADLRLRPSTTRSRRPFWSPPRRRSRARWQPRSSGRCRCARATQSW